jgi:uncharacterized protein YprB with RNaseH-like and TPR domain
MPTLSDKLRSLGVKVGAPDLAPPIGPPRSRDPFSIERIVPGRLVPTPNGEVYTVEEFLPHAYRHGHIGLQLESSLGIVAEWAGYRSIRQCSIERFVYLDIETTGLMGGTGTYAFLVGVGRFEQEGFHLAQFFMRDPIEEPAQLLAIEEFLAPCETLVTFNGKTFDVPILNTRYLTQGWKPPFVEVAQIDLLHISRRLWRERLPSRTLGNIETHILGARRTEEDVPGWMIPGLYFDYLRSGDARPLKSIFYHNAQDVLALAALLNHVSSLVEDPLHAPGILGIELLSTARLFEDLGREQDACQIYQRCLEHDLPEDLFSETVQRLSLLKKRQGEYALAVELWQQAAGQGQIYAHVELAKYYEHQRRDYAEAARWTGLALERVIAPGSSPLTRLEWLGELEHRMDRLRRKLSVGG